MRDDDPTPPVACTITEDRAEERAGWLRETLLPAYAGAEVREDHVTVAFEGTEDTLVAVARFVAEEQQCCAFADYRLEVSPPYEETRLTISGPPGTTALFADGLVDRLEGASSGVPMD